MDPVHRPSSEGSEREPEPVYELEAEPEAAAAESIICTGCGSLVVGSAPVCGRCGCDPRVGVRAMTGIDGKRRVRRCEGCGYDLTGLKTAVCPECGGLFTPKDRRRLDREHSKEVARAEWARPGVMLGIGGAIMLGVGLADGGLGSALSYLTIFAITLPVGIIAYLVCCIGGLGFDAPLPLMAWRLVGVFALLDVAQWASSGTGNDYLMWGLPAVVAIVIFERVFDLDWPEAFAAGVVTYAARKVAVMAWTGQLAALF